MSDEYASWSTALVIVGFVIEFIYHGYLSALEALNEASLEREASDEDSSEAKELLGLLSRHRKIRISRMTWTVLIALLWGVVVLRGLMKSFSLAGLTGIGLAGAVGGIVLLFTVLLVSIAHLVPEWMAARKPKQWAIRLRKLVNVLSVPVWPLTWLAEALATLAVKIVGIDPNAEDSVTEDEIVSMVNEGHEQGVIEASEAEMINNIIEFGDKEAGDIMTHRKNIMAVSGDMLLENAVTDLLEAGYSRAPVYEEELDNVVGFLNLKDAVLAARDPSSAGRTIREIDGLLREIRFIPETRNINDLFKTMQSEKIHIVMVVDEYGQIDGLITMEDVLEEIVGNILDEYDDEEKYVVHLENGYLFQGMTPLDEVSELLDLRLEDEEYDTLNGFLISLLDRIPGEDEKPELDYEGYHFAVEKVENKMIHTVRVTPLPKEEN